MTKMNKIINEGYKDIVEWTKQFPESHERVVKYWLRHSYQQGKIAGLEWKIKHNT